MFLMFFNLTLMFFYKYERNAWSYWQTNDVTSWYDITWSVSDPEVSKGRRVSSAVGAMVEALTIPAPTAESRFSGTLKVASFRRLRQKAAM